MLRRIFSQIGGAGEKLAAEIGENLDEIQQMTRRSDARALTGELLLSSGAR
jgi:hypothetical protein